MKKSPFVKIILTIVIALFIPLLSYTIFQFIESDKNEALIRSIYENQLDTILFSVNQNSSDVFDSWVEELNSNLSGLKGVNADQNLDSALAKFVDRKIPVLGAVIELVDGRQIDYWDSDLFGDKFVFSKIWDQKKFDQLLISAAKDIERMKRRARDGYTNPIAVQWDSSNDSKTTFLIFPITSGRNGDTDLPLIGLLIDNQIYVEEIVARKIRTMDLSAIELAVQDIETEQVLFSSEEIPSIEFEKSAKLWIISNLIIHIKLTGTTLKDISFARSRTNLIFLGVVNFVLLVGVLYLLRNVRMQMKLAKMQTDFVANVSHELRTPLAVIRMFAETLEMGRVNLEEKKQQYYRSIVGESTRLTQLINNILDFSRIESKKKTFHPIITSIRDLVAETMDMYQFHLNQKGFKYDLILEDNLPELYIDPESVKQAFLNLLENAVKFSFEEKKIIVKLENFGGKVILSVQDFGIGIHESEQTKIFEKFYRASNVQKYQTKGSGLGLVLVKNIMTKHGGRVMLKSKTGYGSTFSLVFPIPNRKGH